MLGFKMSMAAKEKMAKAARARPKRNLSSEHKARVSAARRKLFPPLSPKKCLGCNNTINARKRYRFCSLSCRAKNLSVVVSCKSCRNKFPVYRSQLVQNGIPKRFCSRKCFYAFQIEHPNGTPLQLEFGFSFKEKLQSQLS